MRPEGPDTALASALTKAQAFCFDLVRREDPDRWFASLFLPSPARPHVHAVFAFNLEVARIANVVSEPMPGEIRLQWWRDAIADDAPAGNPVAIALVETIRRFNLDKVRFLALIEARAFDLYTDPMPNEAALDGYLRDTSSTLFAAVARILAPDRLPPGAADRAGCGYGLTMLLCGLPWQVMKGQLFVPLDMLARFQLPPEHVLAHRNSPAFGLVLNALRAKARVHLDAMRADLDEAGPAAAACLPAFLCEPYLRQMEKPALDPFQTPVEIAKWRRQWILWRAAQRLP